ncbi:MAG TPA: M48 family metalloprotease [Burkholderiaceae bacterium]|nr:M48 family metalloprotease [Burkholderiaceae bacterium]
MQAPSPDAARWARIKTFSTFAIALGSSACAFSPASETVSSAGASHVTGCAPISTEDPDRQSIEADVAAFVRAVPGSRTARFEVQNCLMDGQVADGKTIVLSSRLARLPQPQRRFIIAHEFAHHQLGHRTEVAGAPAAILSQAARSSHATHLTEADLAEFAAIERAHRMELEADAHAARLMHMQGVDPEQAARMFDEMGAGVDTDTHPAFSRRAQAIRKLIATFGDSGVPSWEAAGPR